MKQLLDKTETLTFSANASNEQQDVPQPSNEVYHVHEIDTANQDADLTINEVYIDGNPLGVTAFPIDLASLYGENVPSYNNITIEASESAGSQATVDIILNGFKEST